MDKDLFVQKVQFYCDAKGISPTKACRESGVGSTLLTNLKNRGVVPSVEKIQQLAAYLGVTTSELLGENSPGDNESVLSAEDRTLLSSFHTLNAEGRERLLETADDMVRSGKYIKIDPDKVVQKT